MSKCACRQLEIGQAVRLVDTKLPPLSPARELGDWARKKAYVAKRSWDPERTPMMSRHVCEVLVSRQKELLWAHPYWIPAELFEPIPGIGNTPCAVDVAKLLTEI